MALDVIAELAEEGRRPRLSRCCGSCICRGRRIRRCHAAQRRNEALGGALVTHLERSTLADALAATLV